MKPYVRDSWDKARTEAQYNINADEPLTSLEQDEIRTDLRVKDKHGNFMSM